MQMRSILQNKLHSNTTRGLTLLCDLWLQKPIWYLEDENPDHLLAAGCYKKRQNQIYMDNFTGSFYKLCSLKMKLNVSKNILYCNKDR